MSDPFIGEIRIVGFTFPPKGWAFCNGQLLSIQQNAALFSLLGTTYGGNGQTNFALPNFQGRTGIHWGTQPGGPTYAIGQAAGEQAHTLVPNELPAHNHAIQGAGAPKDNNPSPDGTYLGSSSGVNWFAPPPATAALNPGTVGSAGGGQAHPNMQPYLVLNFVIALVGIYPSRN